MRLGTGTFGKVALALASASLIVAPAAAQAQTPITRGSAQVVKPSKLNGNATLLFFLSIAVVAAAIALLPNSDNGDPVSP